VLNIEEQSILFDIATEAIRSNLRRKIAPPIDLDSYSNSLTSNKSCFVTLILNNELRGCIGALSSDHSLIEDVSEHAIAAAFSDPRFPPLTEKERKDVVVEISVLETPSPLDFTTETDLLEKIHEGEDGLILEEGFHRGTFLPSVWENLPDKTDFLKHLKLKAGLPMDYWSTSITIQRYTVQKFGKPMKT